MPIAEAKKHRRQLSDPDYMGKAIGGVAEALMPMIMAWLYDEDEIMMRTPFFDEAVRKSHKGDDDELFQEKFLT